MYQAFEACDVGWPTNPRDRARTIGHQDNARVCYLIARRAMEMGRATDRQIEWQEKAARYSKFARISMGIEGRVIRSSVDVTRALMAQHNAATYAKAAQEAVTGYHRRHFQQQAANWSARARHAMGVE